MSAYRVAFVTVNGVRLRLAVTGAGLPLMFLFGSGAAGTIDGAKPLVDKFSDAFMVACPEQRGLGLSEVPPGPWTMADYAHDAFAVADYLGWGRFSVIGISFGGMVGLEMAAADPQRIDRMVLWGTSPGGSAHSYPIHELADLPDGERLRRFAEVLDTRLEDRWAAGPTPESQLVEAVLKAGGSPWPQGDVESERQRGLALQLEARRGHDTVGRLGLIEASTLIGAGTYDGLAPVYNAEVMWRAISSSQLRVYEAGHFFYLGKKAFGDGLSFLLNEEPLRVSGTGRLALNAQQLVNRFGNPPE